MSRVFFIPPATPKLRSSPPIGGAWQFEVKFDGYRVQLHKARGAAIVLGKNGGDFTTRYPTIVAAVAGVPVGSCIIDGELIAAGAVGEPSFLALLRGKAPVCVYAFDLLEMQGRDLRGLPLKQRRARLERLLARSKGDLIRFSEAFPDANALLAECSRRGLEGIVANGCALPIRHAQRLGQDQDFRMEGGEPIPR